MNCTQEIKDFPSLLQKKKCRTWFSCS